LAVRGLSVAKLALGQEAYYEQHVALGLDDYYAGRGESPLRMSEPLEALVSGGAERRAAADVSPRP
jgi:hypothetical protein